MLSRDDATIQSGRDQSLSNPRAKSVLSPCCQIYKYSSGSAVLSPQSLQVCNGAFAKVAVDRWISVIPFLPGGKMTQHSLDG
jgi:hypothetical protein